MFMRAIAELTMRHEVAQFGEIGIDLFGFGIPQREAFPARRIGHISAAIEREHLARDRGVPAFFHGSADLVHRQPQPGLNHHSANWIFPRRWVPQAR